MMHFQLVFVYGVKQKISVHIFYLQISCMFTVVKYQIVLKLIVFSTFFIF